MRLHLDLSCARVGRILPNYIIQNFTQLTPTFKPLHSQKCSFDALNLIQKLEVHRMFVAIKIILVFVHFLKLGALFIPSLALPGLTMAEAFKRIGPFLFYFSVISYGISMTFTIGFGSAVYSYHSVFWSFWSILRAIVGDIDFFEFWDTQVGLRVLRV